MPVVLSERQTSGRGRHGHVWISPPGSVYLSLLWISAAKPSQAVSLPLVAALATREALASFTTCPISLKWPNDLLTPEGKLAGILVENTDMPGAWIIGVGANVTPPHRVEEGFAKAAYVGTKSAEIETVAAALVNSLLDNLHVWEQEGCSFAPFEKDYQRYLLKKGND
jgi:BirA family biotin operon repressor/biotin-[acetyl-CoA-carboxylase] ligase